MSALIFLAIVLIAVFVSSFFNKSDHLLNKPDEEEIEQNSPINWMLIFTSMVILFPITVLIIFANCSWGGCDSKSTAFFLGTELFVGVFALIAAIIVKIKK